MSDTSGHREELLTSELVARKLGVSRATLLSLVRTGKLPPDLHRVLVVRGRHGIFKLRFWPENAVPVLQAVLQIARGVAPKRKPGRPRLTPEQKVAAAARRAMLRERRETLKAIDWWDVYGNQLKSANYVQWARCEKLLSKHALLAPGSNKLDPEAVERFRKMKP